MRSPALRCALVVAVVSSVGGIIGTGGVGPGVALAAAPPSPAIATFVAPLIAAHVAALDGRLDLTDACPLPPRLSGEPR